MSQSARRNMTAEKEIGIATELNAASFLA